MDSSPFLWLSEMGLDGSTFTDESDFMDSFDEQLAAALRQDLESCLSPGKNSSSASSTLINSIPSTDSITSIPTQLGFEPPPKLQKSNNHSDFSTMHSLINPDTLISSVPIVLDFENADSHENGQQETFRALNPEEEAAISDVLMRGQDSLVIYPQDQPKAPPQPLKKPSRVRPPSQTYDHIIAERKRRELLSQRFVALSTIVPGLKKTDKTSVLGDAIKYLKHLQERVKILEEQAAKQTMESVVLVKRSQLWLEDEGSSDEKSGCSDELPLPEIEARVCKDHILIRVHCEKKKGILVNLLGTAEKLNLSIVTTNVTQFGSLVLDITIITEMEKECSLTVKELVTRLREAITSIA